MVCASSLAASVPSAGKMAFMDWRGLDDLSEKGCLPTGDAGRTALAAQVVPEPPAAAAPAGVITPTPAMKDVLRLRKKLREIAKIEEQLAAGMRIDPLQQSKVGKKEEVLAQLQQAERAAIGEEEGGGAEQPEESDRQGPARRAEERQQQQQQQQQRPASHQPPQVGVQVLPVAPCQIAAVSIFQVPVMVCAIIGQPPLGQQPQQQQPQQPQQPQQLQLQLQPQPQQPQRPQQPQQLQLQLQPQPQQPQRPQQLQQLQQPQQAFTWQAYAAVSAQEPRFAPMGQQAAAQAQAWDDESAYQDGQPTKTALSTSARRRLRRQRAALRSPGAMEVPAEADAPQSDLSSPCSTASSGKSDGPSGCQELTSALEGSDEARNAALAKLRGSVADLAFERQGCRLVQDAIEVADHATAAELVSELHGRVRDALASPHGNYVIQTVVTALPSGLSGFVVKELRGVGAAVARHRFGCRVLCRLIEHSGANGELSALVGEVLAEAEELVRHPFAHHVVECALEHMPERRPRIAEALAADPAANACHRCASHVVEAALLHCAEKDRQLLAEGLLGRVGVAALAHHQFGCFVLKALLRAPGRASQEARGQLQREAPSLSTSRPGQRLLRDLGFTSAPAA